VPYEDVNVIGDPKALELLIKLTGRTTIPVIMVDDQVVQGFDKPKLKTLLGL
jgi:glutaredoxin